MEARPRQRVDKWLWHARFGRTRTIAAKAVLAGQVRLNRVKISKPAQPVSLGDVLTISLHGQVRVVRILSLAERRLSPAVAATLYEDLTAGSPDSERMMQAGSGVEADTGDLPVRPWPEGHSLSSA